MLLFLWFTVFGGFFSYVWPHSPVSLHVVIFLVVLMITRYFILFYFNFCNVYFWDRERQRMNGAGAEREGDTESEAGSRLWAVSTELDAGLELTNREIMTWAEVGCPTDWATQAPLIPHSILRHIPHSKTLVCK